MVAFIRSTKKEKEIWLWFTKSYGLPNGSKCNNHHYWLLT